MVAAFVEWEGYRAGQCVDDNSIHHLGVISGGFTKVAVIFEPDDIFHGASIGRVDPCRIGGDESWAGYKTKADRAQDRRKT